MSDEVKTEVTMRAAGILFITGGKVLLLQRGPQGDHGGTWGLPAGKIEFGESPVDAAIRETLEETGHAVRNEVLPFAQTVKDGVDFTTFLCLNEEIAPEICDESTAFTWAGLGELPYPIHPGLVGLLDMPDVKRLMHAQMNELNLARAMKAGVLPSPQKYGTLTLFKLRITGTGIAFRSADNQYVYKAPEHYLNADFLERCNGLPVIWEHAEEKTLAGVEFKDKGIGGVMLPYIEGNEVMCIARVYDEAAAQLMEDEQLSTSPSVVVRDADNSTIALESGGTVLLEGKPKLLDHLAVCSLGVWDKGGAPRGVISDNLGATQMDKDENGNKKDAAIAETANKDSDAPAWFKTFCDSQMEFNKGMSARMDSFEQAPIVKKDSEEDDKTKDKKDSKKDSDGEPTNALMDKKDSEDDKSDAKKDAQIVLPAEVQKRLDALELRAVQLTDADFDALSETQLRADSVALAHGGRAPRPMDGETPLAYRKRCAAKFKAHSKAYKDVDISAITDAALFGIVEEAIYKDAQAAAESPEAMPTGMLREHHNMDAAGRRITTFTGDPSGWMNSFKSNKRRVTGFNTK